MAALAALLLLAACGQGNKAVDDNEKETDGQLSQGARLDYVPFKDSVDSKRWGLLSVTDGKMLLRDSFDRQPSNVVGGIFYVQNSNGNYEYFTADEQPKKIGGEYKKAGLFYEDIAPCMEKEASGIQFIRRDGSIAFVLDTLNGKKVEWVGRFHEGLAAVKAGELIGYINKEGKTVIAPRFLEAGNFSEGLAVVVDTADGNRQAYQSKQAYRISVIDQKGQRMDYTFASTDSLGRCFSNGVLRHCYQSDDTTAVCEFINHNGQVQIPSKPTYKNVTSVGGTHYGFFNGTTWGVADNLGSTILSPIYDEVVYVGQESVALCEYGLYKIKNYRGEQLSRSYEKMKHLEGSNSYLAKKGEQWYIVSNEGSVLGEGHHLIESVEPDEIFRR